MRKLTLDFVMSEFEKEGYEVLSNHYEGSMSKIKFKCSAGHVHSITWGNWQQGHRCTFCKKNAQLDIDFVKDKFSLDGYEVTSKTYKNSYSKIKYVCPLGHRHSITWADWYKGSRCPTCYNIQKSLDRMGPKSHFWKGGISCDSYCDAWADKEYKKSVKERDGHRCLNPSCLRECGTLSIHHIDYNKKNCHPSNLITLCVSCNSKANFERDWHKSWYTAISKRRNF